MTREEILAMPAGRELDALVIKKLEFELNSVDGMGHWVYIGDDQDATLFRPSENVRDAWHAIDKLYNKGAESFEVGCYRVGGEKKYVGKTIKKGIYYRTEAKTAPEAICKAALIAVLEESQ